MKTKTEIIQALLNEGKITASDAVILLTPDNPIFYPYQPYAPYQPYYLNPPYVVRYL